MWLAAGPDVVPHTQPRRSLASYKTGEADCHLEQNLCVSRRPRNRAGASSSPQDRTLRALSLGGKLHCRRRSPPRRVAERAAGYNFGGARGRGEGMTAAKILLSSGLARNTVSLAAPTSAFPLGTTAFRADVIRKTTSSWSAASYIPKIHDGSAGLAYAKGVRTVMHTSRTKPSTAS
jgi:hypothetical protein